MQAYDVLGAQEEEIHEDGQQIDERSLPIGDESDDAGESSNAIGFGDIVRLIVVLLVVVGIIYGIYAFLRRASRSQFQTSDLLRIVGSLSLGGSRAMHIVEIARNYYIVGSGDQGITLISEITDKETVDLIRAHTKQNTRTSNSFREQIHALLGSIGGQKFGGNAKDRRSFSALKKQRNRLPHIDLSNGKSERGQ